MAFILVIVQAPQRETPSGVADWMSFHTAAKLESLKELPAVYCLDETAWIFDTRRALAEFGLVTHHATERGIPLHAFQLDNSSLQSYVGSQPISEKLEAFLEADLELPKE
ncbi:MAG TPA: hypothetical protein VJU54_06140 [Nitrospiraceae bacterium]|nr:hypothetical protein [Nitrospiraceae bacterium]